MGWNDVNKGALGQGGGRFLQLEPDTTKVIRLLDEEPESAYVHKVTQVVGGQEVFRTIPATVHLDDNYIQNSSARWPATPQHGMHCIEIEDGEPVGDIMVLVGGKQIFGALKLLFDQFGDLRQYDVALTRTGKGRDTEYKVSLAPRHADVDVDELAEEIANDPALSWDAIFPRVDGEQQRRLFEEAGFDITYDPAEDLAETMTLQDALDTRVGAGKYKGKTIRELVVVDAGYLSWMAEKFTSDDEVAAAARVAVRNMGEIAAPTKRQAVGSGAPRKPAKAEAPAKAAPRVQKGGEVKEDAGRRTALMGEINEILASDPRFEDAMEIAQVISTHGNGKTRMRDLTVDELQALRDDIGEGGEETPAPKAAGRRRTARA